MFYGKLSLLCWQCNYTQLTFISQKPFLIWVMFGFVVFLAVWIPSSITWAWHQWHPMQVMVPALEDAMSDIWAMSHIKSPARKVLALPSFQQVHLNLHEQIHPMDLIAWSLFTHPTHLCESGCMGSCPSGWRRSWGRCRISSCTFYGRTYTCIFFLVQLSFPF